MCRHRLREIKSSDLDYESDVDEPYDINQHSGLNEYDEVAIALDALLPNVSWENDCDYQEVTFENFHQCKITLYLTKQTNWLPLLWIEYYTINNNEKAIKFFNSGVRGIIPTVGLQPPEEIFVCRKCQYVTSKNETSLFIELSQKHDFVEMGTYLK